MCLLYRPLSRGSITPAAYGLNHVDGDAGGIPERHFQGLDPKLGQLEVRRRTHYAQRSRLNDGGHAPDVSTGEHEGRFSDVERVLALPAQARCRHRVAKLEQSDHADRDRGRVQDDVTHVAGRDAEQPVETGVIGPDAAFGPCLEADPFSPEGEGCLEVPDDDRGSFHRLEKRHAASAGIG